MGKSPRSFSIDEDINKLLAERDDLNASSIVNNFLREYVAGGRGKEAALETRISQLDEEISELEKELTRKKRERERLTKQLNKEQESLYEAATELADRIRDDRFQANQLTRDNPAVQNSASNAGVQVDRLIEEVETRL